MPLKPIEARSIGSKLVLLFTAAAMLLLSAGVGLLYWIVVQHAFEEDNEALADKLFALRADLKSAGGSSILHEQLEAVRPRERITYWVRILDANRTTVAETPGMSGLLAPEVFPSPTTPSEAIDPHIVRTGGKLWALLATPEEMAGRTFIFQLAQDRSVDEQFARNFGVLALAVLVGGSLISGVIAVTITRRGLRPLAEITRSLERTGPTRLDERVEASAWPRELRPIAIAFDQMLDRLEDSFTRLSQFSADLAHELRTPVANLRGEAEVALNRPRTTEEYREVIESSVAECERLSAIIDNLLFLARAEAAQGLAERTVFEGRPALEKIAAYFRTLAEERHISITCHGQDAIYADALLFSRAVSNLVENALRFSPDSGAIEISLIVDAQGARVAVRDHGPGINAQDLPRIFDRFYRADSSRSSQGSGLGLSLVKSIMNLHAGSVEVSTEPRDGTIVTLTFPAA